MLFDEILVGKRSTIKNSAQKNQILKNHSILRKKLKIVCCFVTKLLLVLEEVSLKVRA